MSKGPGKGGSVQTAAGGTTPVRTAGGIEYAKSDRAVRDGDVAVEVSVSKLDAAWQKDDGYHIPPGGGSDKQKYQNAKDYIAKPDKGPVKMAQVNLDASGNLSVSDGRHRLAAIRDTGKARVWVTVSRAQAKKFKAEFS